MTNLRAITDRYRHETLPFVGLDVADAADSLADMLRRLPGMLHASVSYAAGLIFVAYDSEVLSLTVIDETIRRMGATVQSAQPGSQLGPGRTLPSEEHQGHDHGSAPAFLPHWVQEHWSLILVGLAGGFLAVGWLGETFFAMPANVALVFFLLSYLAGGYDVAHHAIPGLLQGRFDTAVAEGAHFNCQ